MNAVERYSPQVVRGYKIRAVRNLGWLLRNWNDVRHFTIRTQVGNEKLDGCLLVAWLEGGNADHYSCGWAGDIDHVLSWLRRPVFHGLKVYIDPPSSVNAADSAACERLNVRKVEL